MCFDRGGWSPDLFADIIHAGFHLLTYRKNTAGKDIPGLPADKFSVVSHAGDDGRPREYELAESQAELAITKGRAQRQDAHAAAGHPPGQGPAGPHPDQPPGR